MPELCRNCSKNTASVICKQCEAFLCASCDVTIHKNKIFSAHFRKSAEDKSACESLLSHPGRCGKHGEPALAVCEDCKVICCSMCMLSDHNGHDIIQYELCVKKARTEQEALHKDLSDYTALAAAAAAVAQSERNDLSDAKNSALTELTEVFQKMSQQLAQRREALVQDAAQKADVAIKALDATADKLSAECAAAESVLQKEKGKANTVEGTMATEKAMLNVGASLQALIDTDMNSTSELNYTSSDSNIEKEIESLGAALTVKKKYSSSGSNSGNTLRVNTSKDEKGRTVQDLWETSAKLTWAAAPKYLLSLVEKTNSCIEFVLRMKTADSHTIVYTGKETSATCDTITKGVWQQFQVFAVLRSARGSETELWASNVLSVAGRKLGILFEWKPCPSSVTTASKYELDEDTHTIAKQVGGSLGCDRGCTIITTECLQPGATVAWKIRYVNATKHGCCGGVGVAPADINQNKDQNCFNCGWYYNPYASVLRSGPPMKLRDKKYGYKDRSFGSTLSTGDEIGVVMDMANGTLSFVLNGKDCGVAFEGIPLDKPLFPCVLTGHLGDTVEIIPC